MFDRKGNTRNDIKNNPFKLKWWKNKEIYILIQNYVFFVFFYFLSFHFSALSCIRWKEIFHLSSLPSNTPMKKNYIFYFIFIMSSIFSFHFIICWVENRKASLQAGTGIGPHSTAPTTQRKGGRQGDRKSVV